MKKIIERLEEIEWFPVVGIMAVIAMTVTFLLNYYL